MIDGHVNSTPLTPGYPGSQENTYPPRRDHRTSTKTAKREDFALNRAGNALAANRTRGPSMATMDFTTKPLALLYLMFKGCLERGYDPSPGDGTALHYGCWMSLCMAHS